MAGREREGGRLKFCVVIVKLILSVEGKFHEHIRDFLFNSEKTNIFNKWNKILLILFLKRLSKILRKKVI